MVPQVKVMSSAVPVPALMVASVLQEIQDGVSFTLYFSAHEGSPWFFKAFAYDILPADEEENEQATDRD